jgi:hypothetical protein
MPNPSPTVPGPERPAPDRRAAVAALPAELEARIASLEGAPDGEDFDTASWLWMLLLGVLLPVLAIGAGWWLEAAR